MLFSLTTKDFKYKATSAGWFSKNFLKGDFLYQDIEILFENGKPKLQTHCGVILSMIMIGIMISYGYMKAIVMLDKRDY